LGLSVALGGQPDSAPNDGLARRLEKVPISTAQFASHVGASGVGGVMETAQFMQQFRIEEYKALRAEILYQIQNIDQIKFWITAAMAAYYSFISTKFLTINNNRTVLTGPMWIWAVPIVLPLVGLLRLRAHIAQLDIFAQYIKQIEQQYPSLSGWEHYYGEHRAQDYVWNYDLVYFLALLAFSVAVLLLRWQLHRREARK
jgi:hypothetical protein